MNDNHYFTDDTRYYLNRYVHEKNKAKADKIFSVHLYEPLYRIANAWINKYRFYEVSREELIQDTISHMVISAIKNLDKKKGDSFSYLSVVARNYLLSRYQDFKKKQVEKDDLDVVDSSRDVVTEESIKTYNEQFSEFCVMWCKWIDDYSPEFFKNDWNGIRILNSLVVLIRNANNFDIYSKKYFYVLIREECDIDTKIVTKYIKKIKPVFRGMLEHYLVTGKLEYVSGSYGQYR